MKRDFCLIRNDEWDTVLTSDVVDFEDPLYFKLPEANVVLAS